MRTGREPKSKNLDFLSRIWVKLVVSSLINFPFQVFVSIFQYFFSVLFEEFNKNKNLLTIRKLKKYIKIKTS